MEQAQEMETFQKIENTDISNDVSEIPKFDIPKSMEQLAPPDAVQTEMIAEAVKDMGSFEFGQWEKLSPEERISAVQQLENKVAEIEMRPPMQVSIQDLGDGYYGYQDYANGSIVINSDLMASKEYKDYYEVLDTLFHEGRHAYQFTNVFGHATEQNSELVEAWRINLVDLGYESGKSGILDFRNLGFKRYLAQPIEVDARVFAEDVMKQIGITRGGNV